MVEPHFHGRLGAWGRVAKDNRKFINAVVLILRKGAPWRDLPPEYGKSYLIYLSKIQIRGLNTKIRLAVDSYVMPIRIIITDRTVKDCSIADYLLADIRTYMKTVIKLKKVFSS